jgi:ribosomal protein S16
MDKARKWVSNGAQPTETVAKLLKIAESQPAPEPAATAAE